MLWDRGETRATANSKGCRQFFGGRGRYVEADASGPRRHLMIVVVLGKVGGGHDGTMLHLLLCRGLRGMGYD